EFARPEHAEIARAAHERIKDALDRNPDWETQIGGRMYIGVGSHSFVVGEITGELARKRGVGQPLGDLTPGTVLEVFRPLIWSRLKRFRVARIPECEQAASLGLLEALRTYSPSLDVSVGYHAKVVRSIDSAVKAEIRNSETDALGLPGELDLDAPVTGQGREF